MPKAKTTKPSTAPATSSPKPRRPRGRPPFKFLPAPEPPVSSTPAATVPTPPPKPPRPRGRPPFRFRSPTPPSTSPPKPKLRLQNKPKDEIIRLQEEDIGRLEAQVADLQRQKNNLLDSSILMRGEIQQLKDDKISLRREKAALARAVQELAPVRDDRGPSTTTNSLVPSYAGGAMADSILTAILSQPFEAAGARHNNAGQSRERFPVPANPGYLWSQNADVIRVLDALFVHDPPATQLPPADVLTALSPPHREQVAMMNGLGHRYLGLHADLPTFEYDYLAPPMLTLASDLVPASSAPYTMRPFSQCFSSTCASSTAAASPVQTT